MIPIFRELMADGKELKLKKSSDPLAKLIASYSSRWCYSIVAIIDKIFLIHYFCADGSRMTYDMKGRPGAFDAALCHKRQLAQSRLE